MTQLRFTVNGRAVEVSSPPGETLAELLRCRLGLTGTKIGCEEAECGACTVLVDGEAALSCIFPAERAAGRKILTIEGLADEQAAATRRGLHPLQEAFISFGAVQCGFCIPGQLMTADALLRRNPNPSPQEVRAALIGVLCRCGSYPAIEAAVLAAAESLRTGEPVNSPSVTASRFEHHVVGRPHARPDAAAKVSGAAIYTDDLSYPGMLHAKVRRAMVPHAILQALDVEAARSAPGVVLVLTAEDIPGVNSHGLVNQDWPVLVGIGQHVRYVGDALAVVVAATPELAAHAAELIKPEFDPLPIIADPLSAAKPEAYPVHRAGNLLRHIKVRKGNVEQGFHDADLVVEHTFNTPIMEHAFLEPECSVAVPTSDGRLEIHVGSQIPYQDRQQVALALDWPESRVRIIGECMGGGFGGKEDIAGQIHAALAAARTGRPVKLLFDRHESMLVHPKRHATQIRVRAGAKADGRLTAMETELYGDTGAYASLGDKVMARATTHSAGPYEIPNVRADCYAMYTNNPPAGAFRGFGVTQSAFAVESTMDILADRLGMDPVELRQVNALKAGSTTNTGQVLHGSVGLMGCLQRVSAEMRRVATLECGRESTHVFASHSPNGDAKHVHAWGFAAAYKNTGLGGGAVDRAAAEVELCDDGMFEARSSSAEMGQGLTAVMQLIAAEELRVPAERVRVLVMDTDLTPDGGPTTASRQTYVTGNATRLAARALREEISAALAEALDVPPGEIVMDMTGVRLGALSVLSFEEAAGVLKTMGRAPSALYEYDAPSTQELGMGGEMHFAFSFAAQAAEVEVNIVTGEVRVLRVIAANDVGAAINPLGLQAQVTGGIIMGIGGCLTEEFVVENGTIVTDRLGRYRIPSIAMTPQICSILLEHPTAEGPYGAKGVGEICAIPTAAAITNAIYHAVGVRVDRLPVNPELIARSLWQRNNPS